VPPVRPDGRHPRRMSARERGVRGVHRLTEETRGPADGAGRRTGAHPAEDAPGSCSVASTATR
jgi:hypothetical protein